MIRVPTADSQEGTTLFDANNVVRDSGIWVVDCLAVLGPLARGLAQRDGTLPIFN
jgi:hypothetical protein